MSIANGRKPLQPVLTDPFIRLIFYPARNSCVKETLSRAPDWCQSPPSTRLIELGRIFFCKDHLEYRAAKEASELVSYRGSCVPV